MHSSLLVHRTRFAVFHKSEIVDYDHRS